MEACHDRSILIMNDFLDSLGALDGTRAIDIAGGDGRVIKHLLRKRYSAVDCFDMCMESVKILEELRKNLECIEDVDQADMKSFEWQHQYSGIFLRWCIGYLTDEQLVDFLQLASAHLIPSRHRQTRSSRP